MSYTNDRYRRPSDGWDLPDRPDRSDRPDRPDRRDPHYTFSRGPDRPWDRDRDRRENNYRPGEREDRDRGREHDRDRDRDADRDRARDRDRSRESSPRDRTRDSRERQREPPRGPAATRSAPMNSEAPSSRTREDGSGPTVPAAAAPSGPTQPTGGDPRKDLSSILRMCFQLTTERAVLFVKQHHVDKELARKKQEFQKSQTMLTEYPSVPEMQKKYLDRSQTEHDALEVKLKANAERSERYIGNFADKLLTALPLASMHPSDSLRSQPPAVTKKQVDELEAKLSREWEMKYEEKLRVQKEASDAELARVRQSFEGDLTKLKQDNEKGLDSLRAELLGRITSAQPPADVPPIQTQLDNQQSRIHDLEQSQQARASLPPAAQTTPRGISRAEFAGLESEVEALKSSITPLQSLPQTVTSLEQRLAGAGSSHVASGEQTGDLETYQRAVAALQETMQKHGQQLAAHETRLGGIDFENMDAVTDFIMFELPSTRETLAKHTENFKELQKSLQECNDMIKGLDQTSDGILVQCGTWFDELRTSQTALANRVRALEGLGGSARPSPTPNPTSNDTEKLSRDLDTYNETFESKIKGVSEELEKKSEMFSHQISTLDSQFNNLTTKAIAELIIAQLEQVYPANRQIVADLEVLNNRTFTLGNVVGNHTAEIGGLKRQFDSLQEVVLKVQVGDKSGADGDASATALLNNSNSNNQAARANKRRRVENGRMENGSENSMFFDNGI